MLSVTLLGRPELRLDGEAVDLPRRKSRALIYLLAGHPRPLARDQVLALLWPDRERAAAQQLLRTTLHGLRKAIGDSLVAEGDRLSLSPDTEVDSRRFESALQPLPANLHRLDSTLALHRGDFLDGFSLPGASAFDDWAAAERERFRRLAVRGWSTLGALREAEADYPGALDALDRALAFDPLQEDLQRSALRLLHFAGDRAGAIRRYETLRRRLDDEMGVPPTAETRAMYDSIITDSLVPPPVTRLPRPSPLVPSSSGSQLPFTGRGAELEHLRRWHAGPAGRLALLEGEPGIGKTRLAAEFLASLRQGHPLTLASAARELERSIPYRPFVDALRDLASRPDWPALSARLDLAPLWKLEAARLLPELAEQLPPPASADESRLWEGVHQFLLALSRLRPVVLFLDDLHWADASSLALLGYLLRQPHAGGLRVIAASRHPDPRGPLATLRMTLAREDRLLRIPLARLLPEDTSRLASALSPGHADSLGQWLAANAEGNPYVLSELVRHAREAGILGADGRLDEAVLTASPFVPQSVYGLILSRLLRLTEPARRLLDAAVAAGREFEFDVAAWAAGLPEAVALDALDELRGAGIVLPADSTGERYAFDHSLSMEVAYREGGETRHRRLHQRVAEAMEAVHPDRIDSMAGVIAWHYVEGNAPDRAAQYAYRAGRLAEAVAAWPEAMAFYEQALAGAPEDSRLDILMSLGHAHQRAGHFAPSSEAFRAALELAFRREDEVRVDEARLALAFSLLAQSRFGEAIGLARQVLDDGHAESAVRAELLWGTALSLEGTDLPGAAEHLHAAESIAREAGDCSSVAHAAFELGSVAAQQGNLPRAVERYREGLVAAEQGGEAAVQWRILSHNNLAYHLLLMGDTAAAEHARAGQALAQEHGHLALLPYLWSTLGEIALEAGDLASAEHHFTQGLALAERLDIPERIAGLRANLGRVAHRRGEATLAIHRLSTALAQADALGTRHLAAQIRLWLVPLLPAAEARARLAEARAIAESGQRRRLLDEIAHLEATLG